ncbi:MAG: DUF6314 family protein [Pseudomonadota bacterium]
MQTRQLSHFEGHWHLARTITHGDGLTATLSGTATFTPRGRALDYEELGALSIAGAAPFEASQRYTWGAPLRVFFPDGRPFHDVPASGGTASHWCAPDQYDGAYDFADWPTWRVTWQVRGPRKDYTSETTYWR